MEDKFNAWLELRKLSKDEFGDMLCYCGHTDSCNCSDPTLTIFKDSIRNGVLDVTDSKNGWESVEF